MNNLKEDYKILTTEFHILNETIKKGGLHPIKHTKHYFLEEPAKPFLINNFR